MSVDQSPPLAFTGGVVYSSATFYPTALTCENGTVTWVGQDAAVAGVSPHATCIDMNGGWLAPAFVSSPFTAAPAAGSGIVKADSLLCENTTLTMDDNERSVPEFVNSLADLAAKHSTLAVATTSPAIIGIPQLSDDHIQVFASVGGSIIIDPLTHDISSASMQRWAKAGISIGIDCGTAATSVWTMLHTVATHPRGLSVRATLNAATRGMWRALGHRGVEPGIIRPGSPATLALWSDIDLSVAHDHNDTIQRWSTDPRSGQPETPDLSNPHATESARCELTVSEGQLCQLS